ncbi:MAG: helix-turn-helix domain-containing protein [Oligoflexia bacterium]|nr:helix-turn-helix domain-containing protein [Oligoflexia bacterium]
MLDSLFRKFGLGNSEAQVYSELLQAGALTAGALAKRLKIPRSSLYGFLANLSEIGLVKQSERHAVKFWRAEAPERISTLLDSQITSWESAKEQFAGLLPQLKSKEARDFVAPKFSFYEGAQGVRQILEDVLLYRDISTECFWPAKEMMEMLGYDYMEQHNLRRIRQGIFIRSIWMPGKMVDVSRHIFLGVGKPFKREIRIAPQGVDCAMGYWAYHNKVGFISSRKESFGFIVESLELRQLLKTQFDLLWQLSKVHAVDLKLTEKFLDKI